MLHVTYSPFFFYMKNTKRINVFCRIAVSYTKERGGVHLWFHWKWNNKKKKGFMEKVMSLNHLS